MGYTTGYPWNTRLGSTANCAVIPMHTTPILISGAKIIQQVRSNFMIVNGEDSLKIWETKVK